ncbi:putative indole-3-pyruvate monooxygenase YUCCA7 [Leucoagaricus sp. SymC.cos]|nr:putative indole-3-pyruvate monooxygenase YUCCA7 [Leucoagaricus sp. SymC.cos]
MGKSSFDPNTIVSTWLSSFEAALKARDPQAAAACILPDGWLRESHIFVWDNRTHQGRDTIYRHLVERLPHRCFSNFHTDDRPYLTPERAEVMPSHEGVKSGFLFETAAQWGRGYVQLIQDEDQTWKAKVVYMTAADIKGQEESGREIGVYGGHTIPWPTVYGARRKEIEENPHVLIIGAGQTGIMVAARFKQMNIPSLVIEATPRVGDVWRDRYESLLLHTPRMHDHFLYQRFPQNWPLHTPKDKLASWMEQYADSHDLTVWTSTTTADDSIPIYDESTKRWTVTVVRAGQRITLHPAHIISAIGTLGPRIMPEVKTPERFKGTVIHGGDYKSSEPFKNKRVVVVGAGNTAGDICLDLSSCADTITLVQRSPSVLVPVEVVVNHLSRGWPDDGSIPTEVSDFKWGSTPIKLLRSIMKMKKAGGGGEDGKYAALYRGLREKGMIVNSGEDGEGNMIKVLEKFAGFMLDVGCSKLVISGRVGVKHGVEVAELKEESVVFTDGSEIPADVVIFATGYESIHHTLIKIFGKETIDRAGGIWGLDEEGELRNVYRPSGHPGLWYCAGGFQICRYGSKQLAMLIKASDLGLTVN